MYFDVWTDDVLKAIHTLKGRITPEDCLLANVVLFKIMKSPLWRSEFQDIKLVVHEDNSGYSFIDFAEVVDFDNDRLTIREASVFNALDHHYEYPMFSEGEYELWPYDKNAQRIEYLDPPSLDFLSEVEDLLSENRYYQKFLTRDPVAIDSFKQECNQIECNVIEVDGLADLIQSTGISRYDTYVVTQLFGHRYAARDENRIYVVAQNLLGPVGILSLFDHSRPGVLSRQQDLLSVSFVSVCPGYRRQGIASQLMRTAFDYCLKHEKLLSRTEPSEIGKLTQSHFSELARQYAPGLPFMSRQEMQAYYYMERVIPGLTKMSYKGRTGIIQQGLERIRRHEPQMFDLSDAQEIEIRRFCETYSTTQDKGF